MQQESNGDDNQNQVNQQNKGNNSKRGFASMDPEQQRQIAREGGKAAHRQGWRINLIPKKPDRRAGKAGKPLVRTANIWPQSGAGEAKLPVVAGEMLKKNKKFQNSSFG